MNTDNFARHPWFFTPNFRRYGMLNWRPLTVENPRPGSDSAAKCVWTFTLTGFEDENRRKNKNSLGRGLPKRWSLV